MALDEQQPVSSRFLGAQVNRSVDRSVSCAAKKYRRDEFLKLLDSASDGNLQWEKQKLLGQGAGCVSTAKYGH